jgi:hypothetical protein
MQLPISVWSPKPVWEEPFTITQKWAIKRFTFSDFSWSDNIVCFCGEGRVSLPVIEHNSMTNVAITSNGRKYLLHPDNYGEHPVANHVLMFWIKIHGILKFEDVSHLYTKPKIEKSPIFGNDVKLKPSYEVIPLLKKDIE